MGHFSRALRDRRSTRLALGLVAFAAMAVRGSRGTLPADPGPRGPRTEAQAAIEGQSVCIGSAVASAGRLGDVLYYRATQAADGTVHVGYFAFFSEERPWGNNWLTWTVVPALAVDMVYSRALLVAPGLQRALYGAGDVEGVTIVYRRDAVGRLSIDRAFVDDRSERQIELSRAEILALDPQRPTFYSDVWSHQLGGRSAGKRADLVDERCYQGDSVRPLPDRVARAFHLDGRRAAPAHVERLGGRRLDDVDPQRAALASAP
jgi:hypothetical protein